MNGIDVVLVVLLLIFTVRGFWRGFFRESFGFLALVVGLALALRFADRGAALLAVWLDFPELSAAARLGIAFVGIFVVVQTAINLIGLLCDAVVGRAALRRVSRVTGAGFAVAKGGAILAFVLLFLQLFPVAPQLDRQIMESRLARPLVSVAGLVIRVGWRDVHPGKGEA